MLICPFNNCFCIQDNEIASSLRIAIQLQEDFRATARRLLGLGLGIGLLLGLGFGLDRVPRISRNLNSQDISLFPFTVVCPLLLTQSGISCQHLVCIKVDEDNRPAKSCSNKSDIVCALFKTNR